MLLLRADEDGEALVRAGEGALMSQPNLPNIRVRDYRPPLPTS